MKPSNTKLHRRALRGLTCRLPFTACRVFQRNISPKWKLILPYGAVLLGLSSMGSSVLTSTVHFEWIAVPDHSANATQLPRTRSIQDSRTEAALRQAFDELKQPIFTRIAAISPALMALPKGEPHQSPGLNVAEVAAPDLDADLPQETVEALHLEARPLLQFAGIWAPRANACSPGSNNRQFLPAVINEEGAWAGEVSCRFRRIKQSGNVAVATSTCSDGRQKWTAKVRLTLAGDRLVWSSERGSQSYVRCPQRIIEAKATI
jgi:hypothetical protein